MHKSRLVSYELSNFKKCDSLSIDDIGQVNLVTGDNNVGKTCLPESLLVNDDLKRNVTNFYFILQT
jgi:AAA15 family ATPase/GTPase